MTLNYHGGAVIELGDITSEDAAFLVSMATDAAQYANGQLSDPEKGKSYEHLQEQYTDFLRFLCTLQPGSSWSYTPE